MGSTKAFEAGAMHCYIDDKEVTVDEFRGTLVLRDNQKKA